MTRQTRTKPPKMVSKHLVSKHNGYLFSELYSIYGTLKGLLHDLEALEGPVDNGNVQVSKTLALKLKAL